MNTPARDQMKPIEARHDLLSFLAQETDRLAAEYERLTPRVPEDPGTAGDQTEENWARLLREWLPPALHVSTKGRIVSNQGKMSGQVDIVILSPSYPPGLRNAKHYMAGGVLAAFEVKRRLTKDHIARAFEQSVTVKTTSGHTREASPRGWLCAPILFGVLAHSHTFSASGGKQAIWDDVSELLQKNTEVLCSEPYFMPDLFCISDLGTWSAFKHFTPRGEKNAAGRYTQALGPHVGYSGPCSFFPNQERFSPIGSLLTSLYAKLARREPQMLSLWRDFWLIGVGGEAAGTGSPVDPAKIPPWIASGIAQVGLGDEPTDDWGCVFR